MHNGVLVLRVPHMGGNSMSMQVSIRSHEPPLFKLIVGKQAGPTIYTAFNQTKQQARTGRGRR